MQALLIIKLELIDHGTFILPIWNCLFLTYFFEIGQDSSRDEWRSRDTLFDTHYVSVGRPVLSRRPEPDTRYQLWPNKACVTRNFLSVCKTNILIGQTSKAHQSKQSDRSNCTHCAPRFGEIEIHFCFRATNVLFLKCRS